MIEQGAASAVLVYEGVPIRRRDEKLNLTDMWRAAGADPYKQPAVWRRQEATEAFVAYLAANLIVDQDELFHVVRGGPEPATYAHWQIGLAYAKYLSPAFRGGKIPRRTFPGS